MHHRAPAPPPTAPLRRVAAALSQRLARRRGTLLAAAVLVALSGGAGLALPAAGAPDPTATTAGQAATSATSARLVDVAARRSIPTAEGTPAPSTGAPAPSTRAPAHSTGAPAHSTGAPAPSTGAPAPSTGAPAPSGGHTAASQATDGNSGSGAGDRTGLSHRHGDHRRQNPQPAQAPNPACSLQVPADPTSAAGLTTPYRLTATDPRAGACHEAEADQSAFVEAAIYDPGTSSVSIYHPVVVDSGDRPAQPPVAVQLPAGAVVGVWFGFNGDTLTLTGPGAQQCVNGLPGSPFGQFAYCNAPAFFAAARADAALPIPPLGTGTDGRPCPTTRDFSVVDQDQSDNLATVYRVVHGRIAQNTAATRSGTALSNGSDEGLLATAIDPALGCTPPMAPDLSDGGAPAPALALNELSAAKHQTAPAALVPLSDPMVLVDGQQSARKTDLYRAGVDQPSLAVDPGQSPRAYCADIQNIAPRRLAADAAQFRAAPAPAAGAANLLGFLRDRLTTTLTNLGCTASPSADSPTTTSVAAARGATG
jgi:hypothetical protein